MKKIEILDKRKKREKHYLQEDGSFIAELYDDDIHFLNNGKYEEIDNTLELEEDYYVNKSNDYKVYFSNKCNSEVMKLEQNGHYIITNIKNNKNYTIEKENSKSKLCDTIKYIEVLKNIDISYDVTPSKVKENIFIKNKDADIDNLIFEIKTDLDLELKEKTIIVKDNNKNIFSIESPYMIDADGNINENVYYSLLKSDNSYELKINLDLEWIQTSKYPIIIDPTISQYSDGNSVIDTYIYEGDTGITKSNLDYFKVGVERNNNIDIKNRALLWFQLPELGTGSQIISAKLLLSAYPDVPNNYNQTYIDIHKVTSPWMNTEPNWNTMNNAYDSRVEGNMIARRSYTISNNIIHYSSSISDITSLVQKWYTDESNNGIMLKLSNEVYNPNILPTFFSKENNISGGDPKPLLIIVYRNQNGIEDYMQMETQQITGGKIFHNTFNGNMIAVFDLLKTGGSILPAELKLIYNTNDVILNNDYGCGLGYKFNLYQTIEEEYIDGRKYLKYLDDTGTIHYFLNQRNILNESTSTLIQETFENKYYDEDGLNLMIEEFNGYYILEDRKKSKNKFIINNSIGYLSEVEDSNGDKVYINYDINNKIISITDPNNKEIQISYASNCIILNNQNSIIILYYNNNNLTRIEKNEGSTFITNNNNLISEIKDVNEKSLKYYYYSELPYKLKKVEEYGINNSLGKYYTIVYGHYTSLLCNSNGRYKSITFNSKGNPISISGLINDNNLKDAYGNRVEYRDDDIVLNNFVNKKLGNNYPIKYVNNLLLNSSFNDNNIIFNSVNSNCIISDDYSNSGYTSLKVVSNASDGYIYTEKTVETNKWYTFSGYFKNIQEKLNLSLLYEDQNNNFIEASSQIIPYNEDFERYEVSILVPSEASGLIRIKINTLNETTFYLDDIQLEEGRVANNYNFIENSDFALGLDSSWTKTSSNYPVSNIFSVENINNNQKALKIKMYSDNETQLYRTYNIKGKQGDLYTLSFWYKNEGLHNTKYWDEINESHNSVSLLFHPINEVQTDAYIFHEPLNPNDSSWQFFSYNFYAPFDFDNFTIKFYQYLDSNDLYITNINLFKDFKCVKYNYDNDGNLSKKTSLNNNNTEFKYENSKLIGIINPDGKKYNYEYYNDNDKINSALLEDGSSIQLEYDNNNNITQSKKINKHTIKEVDNYISRIRIKGTNLCLGIIKNQILVNEEKHDHNKWVIERYSNDSQYFKIYHNIINNMYFTCDSNNNLVLKPYSDDKSLFLFETNDNGSFSIKNKESNKYMKYVNNSIIFDDKDENNYAYEFYLEQTTDSKFIETNTKYTNDGKFIEETNDSYYDMTKYEYYPNKDLIKKITNSKGYETKYNYNSKNQLISLEQIDRKVLYTYNHNKISSIKQGDRTYNFIYDEFGNLTDVKIGNNVVLMNNTYESNNGNLISKTYGNNQTQLFNYDEFDRISKITTQDNVFDFIYDNQGFLSKIESNSSVVRYIYDLAKHLYKYIKNEFAIKYSYNDSNNITNKKIEYDNSNFYVEYLYQNDNMIQEKYDSITINNSYDELNRLINKNINNIFNIQYKYKDNGKNCSLQIKSIDDGYNYYRYKKDKLTNITHIYTNDELTNKYYYDKYNQLIKENNYITNETIVYKYDVYGNLLSKKYYELNTDNYKHGKEYKYNNSDWIDQLTKIDNQNITYDNMGNPITIGNNISLTWKNGRQLSSYSDLNNTIYYDYDENGIRQSKNINNNIIEYFVENNSIIIEKNGNNMIYYLRDNEGKLVGFYYNNSKYLYLKNDLNDIVGIIDMQGNVVAKYYYDSWGKIIKITDDNDNDITNNDSSIGNINPFRYRSYYYDKETGLYYLNDRYYNPDWGRFISADGTIFASNYIFGNLYSYCNNDPINKIDPYGQGLLSAIKKVVKTVVRTAIKVCTAIANFVGLKTASKRLNQSLQDHPTNICYGEESGRIVNQIKNSNSFQKKVSSIVTKSNVDSFTSIKNELLTFETSDLDLHLAYGHVTMSMEKKAPYKDIVTVTLTDTYDYSHFNYSDYGIKYYPVVFINNVAHKLQQHGIIEEYDYLIQFDYKINERGDPFETE